jgi:hypothetical protein
MTHDSAPAMTHDSAPAMYKAPSHVNEYVCTHLGSRRVPIRIPP